MVLGPAIQYPSGLEPDYWSPAPGAQGYRLALGRVAEGSSPSQLLVAIGMNPSHADEFRSDATVNILANASRVLGYEGWLMLNLYPQRSPSPALLGAFDPTLSRRNCEAITSILNEFGVQEVLAAWGDLRPGPLRTAKVEVLTALAPTDVALFHFGTLTQGGEPRHLNPRAGRYDFFAPKHVISPLQRH